MVAASLRLVLLASLCLLAPPVNADEIANARKAFLSGMKHFDLGEYKGALADFKDGYRAKEDPVFLYNIAQCYRAMNEKPDAVRYYRLYLSRSADAPNRAEVEQKIVSLQAAIDSDRAHASAPEPLKAKPQTAASAQPQSALTPAASLTANAPARKRDPIYKKWWLWTIVGVAAAGIGVGVGVAVAESSAKSSATTFPVAAF